VRWLQGGGGRIPAPYDVGVLMGQQRGQLVVQSVRATIAAHVHARCRQPGGTPGFAYTGFRTPPSASALLPPVNKLSSPWSHSTGVVRGRL
jgi:hypothetical protein